MFIAPLRLLTALISLAILAGGGWLIYEWWDGRWTINAAGYGEFSRPYWMLWTGLALIAWSFLGRFVTPFLLAGPDHRPIERKRAHGQQLPGPGGSELYVETHGRQGAPPVVLTHGWGLDSSFWRYAREDLGERFSVVCWDLPGLGRSKLGREKIVSLECMAECLAAVIEAGTARRPVLVGHSIGGMVIQTLLRDRPDLAPRIAGVVLLNTTLSNPLRCMTFSRVLRALQKPVLEPMEKATAALHPLAWALKWQSWMSGTAHIMVRFGFGRHPTRSQLKHVAHLITLARPRVEAQGNLAMMNWDASEALAKAGVPVLSIGGEHDLVTRPGAAREIAGAAPRAGLEIVEGANHMGPLEAHEHYHNLIADFVLAVQPGSHADRPVTRQPPVRLTSAPRRRPPAEPRPSPQT